LSKRDLSGGALGGQETLLSRKKTIKKKEKQRARIELYLIGGHPFLRRKNRKVNKTKSLGLTAKNPKTPEGVVATWGSGNHRSHSGQGV